jgi:hypothetical protein
VINDGRLSFRALGLLAYILDKPDDWRITAVDLAETHKEGRDAVLTALAELEAAGYLARTKQQDAQGRWSTSSVVTDDPASAPADAGETGAGKPDAGAPGPITSTEPNTETEDAPASRRPDCGARAERDALFNAMVTACGWSYQEMTKRQARSCGVAMAELANVNATPDEVHRRATVFRQLYDKPVTPNALANQWASLREAPLSAAKPKESSVMAGVRRTLAGLCDSKPDDNVVPFLRTGTT